jgi:hypothetical protein
MCSTVGAAQKKDKTDRGLKAGDFLSDELTNAFKRRVPLWALNRLAVMSDLSPLLEAERN